MTLQGLWQALQALFERKPYSWMDSDMRSWRQARADMANLVRSESGKLWVRSEIHVEPVVYPSPRG